MFVRLVPVHSSTNIDVMGSLEFSAKFGQSLSLKVECGKNLHFPSVLLYSNMSQELPKVQSLEHLSKLILLRKPIPCLAFNILEVIPLHSKLFIEGSIFEIESLNLELCTLFH